MPNMTETGRNRKEWIDVCRGMGILLVVLGHSVPVLVKIIYGFHMPLFFVLSGYLYKYPPSGGGGV